MKQAFVAVRAFVYAVGFVSLWAWLALGVRHSDIERGLYLPFWTGFVGISFFALGAIIVLSCVAFFVVEGRGTPAPFDPPRRFVASGPYRFVRNPMYLGALLVLSGFGLLARSPSVLGLVALAALFAHLFVLFFEEPFLADRFGETYAAYRRVTNRWVPRVGIAEPSPETGGPSRAERRP
ncbi:MAG: isoprenylcysteine carboxylmethyltransferase family protein [Thermoanaerobaculia bacterium]|nr:isoprenylcysteine carboxylmethyltransferase family protein [Thermoanaerobaculia bacterium]